MAYTRSDRSTIVLVQTKFMCEHMDEYHQTLPHELHNIMQSSVSVVREMRGGDVTLAGIVRSDPKRAHSNFTEEDKEILLNVITSHTDAIENKKTDTTIKDNKDHKECQCLFS